jgi:hypothetical protein
MNAAHSTNRIAFLKDDPKMLRWHLSTRGYRVSTSQQNKRSLFIAIKLEAFEGLYLSHADGILRPEVWEAWLEVLKADCAIPEFRYTWPAAKRFYAKPFVDFVVDLMRSISRA